MQAYQQPLLTDVDREEAIVLVRPEISKDLRLQIAGYLNLSDFLNLRSASKAWKQDLKDMADIQLPLARALTAIQTRRDLQRVMPTVAPFFREEVEMRLARIDHAEVGARRACCANRILMYIGIGGLVGGAILLAAGEHQAIPGEVKAGIVIMALAVAACLVSVFCGRLTERHGRILDRGGVPRPRSPSTADNGPGWYSGI